jgi:cytosine deaminase
MCTGAILLYGIKKVIIGENKTFLGSESLLRENGIEVVVLNNNECIDMMTNFIQNNPELWNEDIGE